MMKIQLTKCEMCCSERSTYDFFESIDNDYFIVSYEFRIGKTKTKPQYSAMKKGHYKDKGIALVIDDQMVYAMGTNCFITGYCPIEIETEQ